MSVWLEILRRRPDGRHKASRQTTVWSAFQISLKFFPELSHVLTMLPCRQDGRTQFPYRGLVSPDHDICRPDGEFDARNFHIRSSCVRTKKTVFRKSEFWMHDLPYERARPDGNPHRPNGCNCLPISTFLKRNPIANWTLSGVRTCYRNVRTDASLNSSKLLDTGEGPDGKFSSSGRMMLG
jgi:hypothetical protein